MPPNCTAEWIMQTHSCEIKYKKRQISTSGTTSNASVERKMWNTKFTLKHCSSHGQGRTTIVFCMVKYLTHITSHALEKGLACRNSGWTTLWSCSSHSYTVQELSDELYFQMLMFPQDLVLISGPVPFLDCAYIIPVALIQRATPRAPGW